jgi:hypothetical protein
MSSKVVEANAGIHSLAMAVAVRPSHHFFCCRHRRSMEASVPNCVSVKPLSSLSRAGACTVRVFFSQDSFVISACHLHPFHSFFFFPPRCDTFVLDSIYTERYMNLPALNPGGYVNASISNVTAFDNVDYLLAHGSGDDNVHFANSAHLLDMFTKAHIRNFRFRMFTDR